MSLELCILASGSSGNCSVLRSVGTGQVILIDAGIGPRTTAKRLAGTGVAIDDVRAICLTHLDRDHFSPTWIETIARNDIRLFCHQSRRESLRGIIANHSGVPVRIETFNGHPFQPGSGITTSAISFQHDEAGSHGFVFEIAGAKLGYATDLGRVPASLIERFCDVDLLAIESNYDPEMELSSNRPGFLKQRIMGGRGHLSNEQAFQAVRTIFDRCYSIRRRVPEHVVLLHRSRQCNCPKLLRNLFERDERIKPRLTLSDQYVRTEWLSARKRAPLVGEQMMLPL